jgi:hypothetical protein
VKYKFVDGVPHHRDATVVQVELYTIYTLATIESHLPGVGTKGWQQQQENTQM